MKQECIHNKKKLGWPLIRQKHSRFWGMVFGSIKIMFEGMNLVSQWESTGAIYPQTTTSLPPCIGFLFHSSEGSSVLLITSLSSTNLAAFLPALQLTSPWRGLIWESEIGFAVGRDAVSLLLYQQCSCYLQASTLVILRDRPRRVKRAQCYFSYKWCIVLWIVRAP